MKPFNKHLYREIDLILWEDWDPCGVNDVTAARDEYQSYLPGLYKLIKKYKPVEEIQKTPEEHS